jgi:hypothetical protein
LDRHVFRQLQQKVPRLRRVMTLYSRLQQDDPPTPERDRRIGQTITLGCSKADRTCGEGRHYRAGRLGVEMQVRARPTARARGHHARQGQPVAHPEPTCSARGLGRVISGECELFFEPLCIDEIFDEEGVLARPRHSQPGIREEDAGRVHVALAAEARQIVERFGPLRALIERGQGLAYKTALVPHHA